MNEAAFRGAFYRATKACDIRALYELLDAIDKVDDSVDAKVEFLRKARDSALTILEQPPVYYGEYDIRKKPKTEEQLMREERKKQKQKPRRRAWQDWDKYQ